MRRYSMALVGFVLAAAVASPVLAGNVGPASPAGGTVNGSMLPPAGDPGPAEAPGPCTCWVDGSQVVKHSGLNHRVPREESPTERAQK